MTTIGSLCSGYGGLDLAAAQVFGGRVAWHAENDSDASRVLAAHWPDVPNHGDLTAVDWSTVEPVDVLTAGFPCQDVSTAGRRAGIAPGTRSGLWTDVARAIDQLRPPLVLLENVRGLLSARAASDVEPCPWCLGNEPDQPALRALGAVLGDLAGIGYDAAWQSVPAAAVGAPHHRWRVFVTAWPAADAPRVGHRDTGTPSQRRIPAPAVASAAGPVTLLPTPDTTRRHTTRTGPTLAGAVDLLPTPTATRAEHSPATARRRAEVGHQISTSDAVMFLPTPRATDGTHGGPNQRDSSGAPALSGAVCDTDRWGRYAPAITRWETATGRTAPAPTEPGPTGPRLSPRFVEWLMGLPAGHVTDHVRRNPALRILGNGVVPQQAVYAYGLLLNHLPACGGTP